MVEAFLHAHRDEIDGIPVFWADAPPPFVAQLVFRVGRADETLTTGGITHLAEHLAIFGLGQIPVAHNGMVGLILTRFVARGDREDALRYLRDVAASLHDLPLARLDSERRVLASEAGLRSRTPVSALLAARFGARGFGLADHPEHGLRSVDQDALAAWAAERFTRTNSAVWMSGPPPDRLDLSLPDGTRFPSPPGEPISDLNLPSCLGVDLNGVAIGYVCPRASAPKLATDMAAFSLQDRLRQKDAIGYQVAYDWQPLSADRAHVSLIAACLPANLDAVRQGLLDVLDRERTQGPDPESRQRLDSIEERSLSDPAAALAQLDACCQDLLMGARQQPSFWSHLEERRAVPAEDAAAALSAALGSAIILVPTGSSRPPGFAQYRLGRGDQVAGRLFPVWPDSFSDAPKDRPPPRIRIVLGSKGVSHVVEGPYGGTRTVRFEHLAGVALTGYGAMAFVGENDLKVDVRVAQLVEGDAFVEKVREHVPPELFIVLDDGVERWDRIDALARERLGGRSSSWLELEFLALNLRHDENLIEVATAHREGSKGLLALTNSRLMWLRGPRGGDATKVAEIERGAIRSATCGRIGAIGFGLTLTVSGNRGEELIFKRVAPVEVGRSIARLAKHR